MAIDEQFLKPLRQTRKAAVWLAALLGAIGLTGWLAHVPILTRMVPGMPPMKMNTAVCLLLLVFASALEPTGLRRWLRATWIASASLLVVTVASTSLLEYFLGANAGIDELLVRDTSGAGGPPGRMAALTAMALVLLGCANCMRLTGKLAALVQTLGTLAVLLVTPAMVGYLYETSSARPMPFTAISPPTAVALAALGIASVLSRPGAGVLELLAHRSLAGEMARWLFPAAFLLPLVLGWIHWTLDQWSAMSDELNIGTLIAGMIAVLSVAIVLLTRKLQEMETRRTAERERSVEQERIAAAYARSLIEASLDPLVTISPEGHITDVNEATVRVTGVAREQLIGTEFSDYFTEPGKAQQGYREVFDRGLVRDYPLTIRDRAGRLTDVLYNASVYQDATGQVRGVFAAARDITRLKQAEQILRESEQRYRSLTVATAQVVWSTGPDGQVDDMPMWRQLTGQSPAEVRGWGWLNAVHPDDRQRAEAVWSESVRTRSLYAVEYRARRYDGEYIHLAVRGVPVMNADGSFREWVGTCTDITERVLADQEIRRLNSELEQRVAQRTAQLEAANKELEAFTYSVAHDLRAPLRHIDGFARLLADDNREKLNEESVGYLDHILSGTSQMGRLIDDLLNLSRVGRHEIRPEVVGLNRLVEEIVESFQPEIGARNVRWQIAPLPFVECDVLLVRQVFHNLLANAVKFTRPRDPAVIEVGQKKVDGETVLFVRDNGVGFNMKYADKLFGVFQRLHRQEDFEGTGVGLVTVQRIIQKHGGRIWAEAQLDRGAAFYFTLQPPVTHDEASAEPEGELVSQSKGEGA